VIIVPRPNRVGALCIDGRLSVHLSRAWPSVENGWSWEAENWHEGSPWYGWPVTPFRGSRSPGRLMPWPKINHIFRRWGLRNSDLLYNDSQAHYMPLVELSHASVITRSTFLQNWN